MNRLSLYIHIPFCVKKCHYCDFLSAPCKEETRQEYVETLTAMTDKLSMQLVRMKVMNLHHVLSCIKRIVIQD